MQNIKTSVRVKKSNLKNNGITLISLIIMVIILLILAGVSVNFVVNGDIFGKAQNSAKKVNSKIAEQQDQIDNIKVEAGKFDVQSEEQISCIHEWGNWNIVIEATCTSTGIKERECIICNEKETENIVALGHNYAATTCTEPGTCTRCGETTGTALGHNVVNGTCTRCGGTFTITAGEVAGKPEIYGSVVTNYTANGIEWKVFYATTDRIYLIASNYVDNSKLTNAYKNGARCYNSVTYPYSYYWESGPTSLETEGRQDELFMATGYTLNSSNDNSKSVSGLLNTNNWVDFVDTNYADYAIGGPTLEMYIASWNAKGYTTLYTNTNANGYYVGTSANPTTTSVNMSSDTEGYADTLYYPQQSSKSNCNFYWLASTSAFHAIRIMAVGSNGTVNCLGFIGSTNNYAGVRPLVCLKSGVELIENTNGTVTLKK